MAIDTMLKLFVLFFAFYSLSLTFLDKLPRDAVPDHVLSDVG